MKMQRLQFKMCVLWEKIANNKKINIFFQDQECKQWSLGCYCWDSGHSASTPPMAEQRAGPYSYLGGESVKLPLSPRQCEE